MLRTLFPLILLCAISVLFLTQKQMGFLLYVWVVIVLLYMGHAAWHIRKQPNHIPTLVIKMMLCLSSIGIIAMVQGKHHQQARTVADTVVSEIKNYQQQHQTYPNNLKDINITPDASYGIQYHNQTHTPIVSYPSTFAPDTVFFYDLTKGGSWQKQAH